MLVYLVSQTLLPSGPDAEEIAYSDAKKIVEERPRTVRNVVFYPGPQEIELELAGGGKLETSYPSDISALEFEKLLDAQGIPHESSGSGGSAWWSILTYLLPFLLFFGFWTFLMRRGQEKRSDSRRGLSEDSTRGPDETG